MNIIFPKKLYTPVIPLGISIKEGLEILSTFGAPEIEKTGDDMSFRINTPEFDMAIYEENAFVKSVWYDDPLGRIWKVGKKRKISLYLERYGNKEDWELRMNNGWMDYYFNEKSKAAMVYGIHNDVIRFNVWQRT
ncbi:hypothetical protein [Methylomonas sp. ZR1]|uniref:hypothetical protein n=1 Tax=Methylomonas sp. ZR1 TaxID=1797072 RepID=UPI001492693F|nr:hypothetical protein [Methylomonas sp. ZR1]NOV29573.1 hypothetical protein [Methylomonas sp. ZR1]